MRAASQVQWEQVGPFIKQFRELDVDASGRLGEKVHAHGRLEHAPRACVHSVRALTRAACAHALGEKDLRLTEKMGPEALRRAKRASMDLKRTMTVSLRAGGGGGGGGGIDDSTESLLEVQQRLEQRWHDFRSSLRAQMRLPADAHLHFVCIIGSTDFAFSKDSRGTLDGGATSRPVLDAVGEGLALIRIHNRRRGVRERVHLTFGGFTGIGEHTARAFQRKRAAMREARAASAAAASAAAAPGDGTAAAGDAAAPLTAVEAEASGCISVLPEANFSQFPQLWDFVQAGKAPLAIGGETVRLQSRAQARRPAHGAPSLLSARCAVCIGGPARVCCCWYCRCGSRATAPTRCTSWSSPGRRRRSRRSAHAEAPRSSPPPITPSPRRGRSHPPRPSSRPPL